MTIRFASQTEIDNWDKLIITNPDGGTVFQTIEFAQIKKTNFWNPKFLVIDNIHILVLERKIKIFGYYWYVPKGPGVSSAEELEQILPSLHAFAKKNNVFTIKLEPELLETAENIDKLVKYGLKKSKPVQASNTVIVNISKSIEDIMANFSSKARGNIRAAQNAGVTTEIMPITDENCALFYEMMSQTINGRSHVRSLKYFRNFWQTHDQTGTGIFMFAKSNDEILAMDFIMILGHKAARKDAASTRDHSIRGASALLELSAINYLKEKGVKYYDLYGSPPSDQIKNPNHPYYGFGTFKLSFNPQVTDYIGCYDLIIKPFIYKNWRKFGERIAHRAYFSKHHDLYY